MLTIRKARQEDLPSLLAIYNYEIEHGTATFDLNPKTLEERQKWFDLHSGGKYLLLVAEEDGEAVGYASLSPYREWEAYAQTVELSIYVDAAHRGKGIGDQLMQRLWETDCFVDENTLTVNVTRLRKKLESVGLHDFIVTRKGMGYLISEEL